MQILKATFPSLSASLQVISGILRLYIRMPRGWVSYLGTGLFCHPVFYFPAIPLYFLSYFISFQISRLNIAKTKHMVNNISLNVYDLWPGFFFALCFTCQDDFCHIVSDRIQIQFEYICRAHPQTGCIHTWVAATILAF